MSYPNYTRSERIADGVVHVLGVGAAVAGVAILMRMVAHQLGWGPFMATLIYSVGVIAMLSASAAYHMAAHTSYRPILRRLDHAAIYVKIAGTITPFGVLLGTAFGYAVLAMVWLLALFGAATKLLAERGRMSTGWWSQVALGWIGLALIVPLWPHLPPASHWAISAGGAIYTFAIIFYCWESLRFANAIWHFFVLIATACFFFGISSVLITAAPLGP